MMNKTKQTSKIKRKKTAYIQDSGFKYTISQVNAVVLGQQVLMHR